MRKKWKLRITKRPKEKRMTEEGGKGEIRRERDQDDESKKSK
jgi:hypothetical protein